MKLTHILAILLAVSVLANAGIYFGYVPYEQEQISGLIAKDQYAEYEDYAARTAAERCQSQSPGIVVFA